MSPRIKDALVLLAVGAVAVWLSLGLASGEYLAPAIGGSVALAFVLSRLWRLEFDVILVGLVVIGYLAGSRGFAQVMVLPGLPLFPAEVVLGIALAWRLVRRAFARRMPLPEGALAWSLTAWLLLGAGRMVFDLPRFGLLAGRDFAMVYYALFYFVVRDMARQSAARRYLLGCWITGLAALAVLHPLTRMAPDFFLRQFVLHRVPLILHKDDIVQTFFAAGGLLLFHAAAGHARRWIQLVATALFLVAMVSDVRAAMLGGLVATALSALAGRWHFPALQGGLAAAGLALLATVSLIPGQSWAERSLADIADRTATIFQLTPRRAAHENKAYKVDNNRFRLVWWRSVGQEVWDENPLFGLGFGHDLARGFLREYDQELGEEFLARSPHSIAVSAVGRMGVAGGLAWLGISAALCLHCWRAVRRSSALDRGLWLALLVVLVSAYFGVVLEGPMGAIPFWILLGLAHHETTPVADPA